MKNKISLFDTEFAQSNALNHGANTTLRYLTDNRRIVMSDSDISTIYNTRTLATTPASIIVSALLSEGLTSEIVLIDTGESPQGLPELLSINDLTLDMKQVPGATSIMSSLKEYQNKVVINMATYSKRSREGSVRITDLNGFHLAVARAALVSSYQNCSSDTWLNPTLVKFIAQTYASTLVRPIVTHYRLSVPEQLVVTSILTYFVLGRMSDLEDELIMQCDFLGNRVSIKLMVDRFKDIIGTDKKAFTLSRMCDLIVACGPDHMKNFNVDIFKRMVGRVGASFISSNIALEYPPYWVYQLVYTMSDNKTYLNSLLQQTKLLKPAMMFMTNLVSSRQFIPSVRSTVKGTASFDLFSNFDNTENFNLDHTDTEDRFGVTYGTEGLGLIIVGLLVAKLATILYKSHKDFKSYTALKEELSSKLSVYAREIELSYNKYLKACKAFETLPDIINKQHSRFKSTYLRRNIVSIEKFTNQIAEQLASVLQYDNKNASERLVVIFEAPVLICVEYMDGASEIENERMYKLLSRTVSKACAAIRVEDTTIEVMEGDDESALIALIHVKTRIVPNTIKKLTTPPDKGIETLNTNMTSGEEGLGLILIGALGVMLGVGYISSKIDEHKDNSTLQKLLPLIKAYEPLMQKSYGNYVKACKFTNTVSRDINNLDSQLKIAKKSKRYVASEVDAGDMLDEKTFVEQVAKRIVAAVRGTHTNDFKNNSLYLTAQSPLQITVDYESIYADFDSIESDDADDIIVDIIKKIQGIANQYSTKDVVYLVNELPEHNWTEIDVNTFISKSDIAKLMSSIKEVKKSTEGLDFDTDTIDSAINTRTEDGSIIMDQAVGRLYFDGYHLESLDNVAIPSFQRKLVYKKINYEFDKDAKEPNLTLNQIQATQRIVNYGGILDTLSLDFDTQQYSLDRVDVYMDGTVFFHVNANDIKKIAISNCSSMKIDSFVEKVVPYKKNTSVFGNESFFNSAWFEKPFVYYQISDRTDSPISDTLRKSCTEISGALFIYLQLVDGGLKLPEGSQLGSIRYRSINTALLNKQVYVTKYNVRASDFVEKYRVKEVGGNVTVGWKHNPSSSQTTKTIKQLFDECGVIYSVNTGSGKGESAVIKFVESIPKLISGKYSSIKKYCEFLNITEKSTFSEDVVSFIAKDRSTLRLVSYDFSGSSIKLDDLNSTMSEFVEFLNNELHKKSETRNWFIEISGDNDSGYLKLAYKSISTESYNDTVIAASESFLLTGIVIMSIVALLFQKLFKKKDIVSDEISKKIKEMLKPLAEDIGKAYIDYRNVVLNARKISEELTTAGIEHKKYHLFDMMSLKEFVSYAHYVVGTDNVSRDKVKNGMVLLGHQQRMFQINSRNLKGVDAICKKYSTQLTSLDGEMLNNSVFVVVTPSSGIKEQELSKILLEINKIKESYRTAGEKEEQDRVIGAISFKEDKWTAVDKLRITNPNGSLATCVVHFTDDDRNGITDGHRKTFKFLKSNPNFVKSHFDLHKFELFIQDFDIETPSKTIAAQLKMETVHIYPNGSFFIYTTGPGDIDDLNIVIYSHKDLRSIDFDYGSGGGSFLDIADESLDIRMYEPMDLTLYVGTEGIIDTLNNIWKWIVEGFRKLYAKALVFFKRIKEFFSPTSMHERFEIVKNMTSEQRERFDDRLQIHFDSMMNKTVVSINPKMYKWLTKSFLEFYDFAFETLNKDTEGTITYNELIDMWTPKDNFSQDSNDLIGGNIFTGKAIHEFEKERTIKELLKDSGIDNDIKNSSIELLYSKYWNALNVVIVDLEREEREVNSEFNRRLNYNWSSAHQQIADKIQTIGNNLLGSFNKRVSGELTIFKDFFNTVANEIDDFSENSSTSRSISRFFTDAVAENDVLSVRTMIKDSLYVDLSFAEAKEMLRLASGMDGLFDQHDGQELISDKSAWNIDYMSKQMVRIVRNFSHERLEHLMKVIRYLKGTNRHNGAVNNKPAEESLLGMNLFETKITMDNIQLVFNDDNLLEYETPSMEFSITETARNVWKWIVDKIMMIYDKICEFLIKVRDFFSPKKLDSEFEELKTLSPDNEEHVKKILDEINEHINEKKVSVLNPAIFSKLMLSFSKFFELTKSYCSSNYDKLNHAAANAASAEITQLWTDNTSADDDLFLQLVNGKTVKSLEQEVTLSQLIEMTTGTRAQISVDNIYTVYKNLYAQLDSAISTLKREQSSIIDRLGNAVNSPGGGMNIAINAGIKAVVKLNNISAELLVSAKMRLTREVSLYNDVLKNIVVSLKKIIDVDKQDDITLTMDEVSELGRELQALSPFLTLDGYKAYRYAEFYAVIEKHLGPFNQLSFICDNQINAFAYQIPGAMNNYIIMTNATCNAPEWVKNAIVAHEIGHIVKGHNALTLEKLATRDPKSKLVRSILSGLWRSPKDEIEADMYCYEKYGKETTLKLLRYIRPGYGTRLLEKINLMLGRFFKKYGTKTMKENIDKVVPIIPKENDLDTRIRYFENKK